MSFKQKTWKDRISEHPTRRALTDVSNNTTKTVNVAREEGTISQEGDAFSAANMNDLESRIADGFSTLSQDSLKMSSSNPSSDSIKFGINASGQYGYIKQGASEVTPFRNPTGNASPSDVLSGKTFSTASLENASGTRVDLGSEPEMKGGALYNGDVYLYPIPGGDGRNYGIKKGVHASPSNIAGWSGGTLFTKSQYDSNYSSGYNQGVTDADNRANANSINYKSGYNAGAAAQSPIYIPALRWYMSGATQFIFNIGSPRRTYFYIGRVDNSLGLGATSGWEYLHIYLDDTTVLNALDHQGEQINISGYSTLRIEAKTTTQVSNAAIVDIRIT